MHSPFFDEQRKRGKKPHRQSVLCFIQQLNFSSSSKLLLLILLYVEKMGIISRTHYKMCKCFLSRFFCLEMNKSINFVIVFDRFTAFSKHLPCRLQTWFVIVSWLSVCETTWILPSLVVCVAVLHLNFVRTAVLCAWHLNIVMPLSLQSILFLPIELVGIVRSFCSDCALSIFQ